MEMYICQLRQFLEVYLFIRAIFHEMGISLTFNAMKWAFDLATKPPLDETENLRICNKRILHKKNSFTWQRMGLSLPCTAQYHAVEGECVAHCKGCQRICLYNSHNLKGFHHKIVNKSVNTISY